MNKLEYPYYNKYYKLNKKEILTYIKNYKPIILKHIPKELIKYNLQKYNNSYFIIKEDYLKNFYINSVTDYFSEYVRIKCKFGNGISPYEYWKKNKKIIIEQALKKYGTLNIINLREIIYLNTKLCNNLRITVILTILDYFKPKSWLDISAGWGDRLLGAIFYKINYYESCDPNLELHKYYDNIITTFVTKSKRKNFIIHKRGFLESLFEKMDFDIVFSSPPFFKLEKYSDFSENSITKYNTEKDWCDYFFIPSLIKAYNHLKEGGIMILYMGGSNNVMNAMHKLDSIMEYQGIIYFYEKKPRGMYVWKKVSNKKINNI
jgi:16S rRNA G966 N2-methylase RsmD